MSRSWAGGLAVLLLLCGCGSAFDIPGDIGKPQAGLERARLLVAGSTLDVEVARTPAQIQRGLMHRTSLADGHGMLFVFAQPGRQCFWMKNTSVPLTAAFLNADGRVLNLADMEPLSEQAHCSNGDALYVVEAARGWFQLRGVKVDDRVSTAQNASR